MLSISMYVTVLEIIQFAFPCAVQVYTRESGGAAGRHGNGEDKDRDRDRSRSNLGAAELQYLDKLRRTCFIGALEGVNSLTQSLVGHIPQIRGGVGASANLAALLGEIAVSLRRMVGIIEPASVDESITIVRSQCLENLQSIAKLLQRESIIQGTKGGLDLGLGGDHSAATHIPLSSQKLGTGSQINNYLDGDDFMDDIMAVGEELMEFISSFLLLLLFYFFFCYFFFCYFFFFISSTCT